MIRASTHAGQCENCADVAFVKMCQSSAVLQPVASYNGLPRG